MTVRPALYDTSIVSWTHSINLTTNNHPNPQYFALLQHRTPKQQSSMALAVLSFATSLLRRRNKAEHAPRPPPKKSNKVRLIAVLPVLVTITAFTLSFLCVYAGHTPGMMEDYAIFTLNTSRIGENIRQELDDKVMDFQFNFKRSAPVQAAVPAVTPAPTTLITLAPRGGIGGAFSSLTAAGDSKIDSAAAAAKSKAKSLEHAAQSKANSIQSAVGGTVTEAVGDVQSEVVHLVNTAFGEIIAGLALRDFYSVHVMTTCEGAYQFPNGTNITVGNSSLPVPGTHKHVDTCSKHSAVDPLSFLNVFYWIGIVLTGLAMLMGFVGVYSATWKMALFNVLATVPAFCVMGLSSALAHGVAVGVPKLIDFVGGGIGIDGIAGQKFLTLTWAVVILLFINMLLWSLLIFLARRDLEKAEPGGKEAYAMDRVSPPPPASYGRSQY